MNQFQLVEGIQDDKEEDGESETHKEKTNLNVPVSTMKQKSNNVTYSRDLRKSIHSARAKFSATIQTNTRAHTAGSFSGGR
jgi:hypothetical protein